MTEQNNHPVAANLTVADNEADDEAAWETEPDDEATSENQAVANSTASDNEPDKIVSKIQAVANVISTRRPPGLLDLPSEVRVMIFRHLVVFPRGVAFPLWPLRPRPSVNIISTCRLIHREAFHVLYGENQFIDCFRSPYSPLIQSPRIADAVRNVHMVIDMAYRHLEIGKFLNLIQHFGDPAIIRHSLAIDFFVQGPDVTPLTWFVRALGRFTNFKTIELQFYDYLRSDISHLRQHFKTTLKPVLGNAGDFGREGKGLEFHPVDHRHLRREQDTDDWADYLDGIRLGWDKE